MKIPFTAAALAASALAIPLRAQEMHPMQMDPAPVDHGQMDHGQMDHSGMDMPGMDDGPERAVMTNARTRPFAQGSGTSRLPGRDRDMPGLHAMAGEWMVMLHGTASLNYTRASGPRGDDKVYSTSMAMLMADRDTGWGNVQLRSMMSLEPAMDAAGYPNLFATGETAGGRPLVDRQHPHDLFMELAARVEIRAGVGSLFLYGGPVGEPALGPSAFMMRPSARLNPEPPISHHWFDSTHITYGVVTAGYSAATWQIEASGFRGAEPDEKRWNIETPRIDSWSVRGTLTPTPRWAIQASYGQIHQPEATHPGEDEHRFTASAHYGDGKGLSAMAAFSAKQRVPGGTLTAWLGEASWDFSKHDTVFGRVENVANDELFPDHAAPLHDIAFRVTKLQAGYARRIPLDRFELALGGSLAGYVKPSALDAAYGDNPVQWTLFGRITVRR